MSEPARRLIGLAWGVLWRAQAAHLVVVLLAPAVRAVAAAALTIVFLPFTLLGAGAKNVSLADGIRHVAEPGCWVVAAACSYADTVLWSADDPEAARPGASALPEPTPPFQRDVTVRVAWLVVFVAWVALYVWRRERHRPRTGPPPP